MRPMTRCPGQRRRIGHGERGDNWTGHSSARAHANPSYVAFKEIEDPLNLSAMNCDGPLSGVTLSWHDAEAPAERPQQSSHGKHGRVELAALDAADVGLVDP